MLFKKGGVIQSEAKGLRLGGTAVRHARTRASSKLALSPLLSEAEDTHLPHTSHGLRAGSCSLALVRGPSIAETRAAGIRTWERCEKSLAPLKSLGPATGFTRHISNWKQISCFLSFPALQHLLSPPKQVKPLTHKTTLLLSFPVCCFYSCVMHVLKTTCSRAS